MFVPIQGICEDLVLVPLSGTNSYGMASYKVLYFVHNVLQNLLVAIQRLRRRRCYGAHIDPNKGNDHPHNSLCSEH